MFLVLLFAVAAITPAQPPPPPPPGVEETQGPSGDRGGQKLAQSLREFNCVPFQKLGYLCNSSSLEGFAEYEWTHRGLNDFARRFRTMYLTLRKKLSLLGPTNPRIALQGEADSQAIHKFKIWSEVETQLGRPDDRRPSDPITNPDLAWLRSKAVYGALSRALPLESIKILEPIVHKAPDQNTGKYRAARIYIVIK
jgi:hypothetical protein